MPQLKDEIFSISKLTITGEEIGAELDINAESEIFIGHFPGQPVVPGACMLQILKDVFEGALKNNFHLSKAVQIKFMNVLIPQDNLQIQLVITYIPADDGSYDVSAKIGNGDVVFFKFRGNFVTGPPKTYEVLKTS